MKLYNADLSNFAAKCRIAIYEKSAPVDIVPIPGGDLKSAEYLKIYPIGKTPCLEVDGQIIGESEVINEYLEEKFPRPALLPGSPEKRAAARGISRFHDLYLDPPLRTLFPQATAKEKDRQLIDEKLREVNSGLDRLEAIVSSGPYVLGEEFTIGDCALAPTVFFVNLMLPLLGGAPFTGGRPKLAAWWAGVQTRPAVKKVHAEQQKALDEMIASQGQ